MIYHNAKNGFPSSILNEKYTPVVVCISSTPDHKVQQSINNYDVIVTHDMLGSALTLLLEDEVYVIDIEKIISDILEVEHENETLYADH